MVLQFPETSSSTHAMFTSIYDVLSWTVHNPSELKSDHLWTLCAIVRNAALSIHYHHTSLSIVSVFKWRNIVCLREPNHTSYIFIGEHFPHHCHSTSTYPINSIQLTLIPPVECYSYCKCYPLWKYKCLIHKSYRPENLHAWHTVVCTVSTSS